MRILPDTNVLIAAFVSRCLLRLARALRGDVRYRHLHGPAGGIPRKPVRKFRLSPESAAARIALLRAIVQVVTPGPLPSPVCRDPDDDLVLASAVAGQCNFIITGDNDLRVLNEYAGIAIVPPGGFADYERKALGTG